jgi:hypothetical protein
MRKLPARACVQAVSNGKSKKGTGPGMLAITRPNLSGGWRMAHKMKAPKAK